MHAKCKLWEQRASRCCLAVRCSNDTSVRVTSPEQAVAVVFQAILNHSLERDAISARSVAERIGQTTGFLYHHWGSLDAFLEEIASGGWGLLLDAVRLPFTRATASLTSVCVAYVDFALTHPTLYWTMALRPLPALDALGNAPRNLGAVDFCRLLERIDSECFSIRASAIHASLHGLATHALSGRLGGESATLGQVGQKLAIDLGTVFFGDRVGGPLEESR
jgi:AcrR family transcriptional regulator